MLSDEQMSKGAKGRRLFSSFLGFVEGDFFTDSTMGFISISFHHLGDICLSCLSNHLTSKSKQLSNQSTEGQTFKKKMGGGTNSPVLGPFV